MVIEEVLVHNNHNIIVGDTLIVKGYFHNCNYGFNEMRYIVFAEFEDSTLKAGECSNTTTLNTDRGNQTYVEVKKLLTNK